MYPDEQQMEIDGEIVSFPGLKDGKYTMGNPEDPDDKPSFIAPESINLIIDNLANLISAYGVTPDNTSVTQLMDAIAAALAPKAPLASPALTGTPTAPTAVAGTNTTQVATTAFVRAAISALVNSSPAALDTLNELATALGNDPNFATTMTNALALKAPLASPALTGTPTAPTPATGTNTTQVATAAMVTAAVAAEAATARAAENLKAPLSSPALTGTPTAPTASDTTDSTQVATTQFVRNVMPAGTIAMFGGGSAPVGWLLCNGAAVSRSTYAALYSAIGGNWGSGDGSTTFNLPNFLEAAPVGVGTRASGVTSHDAFSLAAFKDDQLENHFHDLFSDSQAGSGMWHSSNAVAQGGSVSEATGRTTTRGVISDGSNGLRVGTVTRGKRIGVNFIVKY